MNMGIDCRLFAVDADTAARMASSPRTAQPLLAQSTGSGCDIHKAWHAIHYVLTGSAMDGPEPNGYLLTGGVPLGPPEDDEDQPRLLTPDQVRAFDGVLQPINNRGELRRRFDHEAMVAAGVYAINEGPDEVDEDLDFTAHFFRILRKFIHQAATAGQGVIVSIG
jgi:hypothetical protein